MLENKISNIDRMRKAIQKEHAKLGITFTESKVPAKDKDGKVILDKDGKPVLHTISTLTNITDEARELMEVFNMNTPCWFKGCEKLREQYNAEKEQSGCKTCKGTIMRKYMQLARVMLDDDPDRQIPQLH